MIMIILISLFYVSRILPKEENFFAKFQVLKIYCMHHL